MQCSRCGEENLPGLTHCFACGRELSVSVEENPLPRLPQACSRNPLEVRARRRPPRAIEVVRVSIEGLRGYEAFARGLLAALGGLVPGLDAALRRAWTEAAVVLGLFLLLGLLLILSWRSLTWGPLLALLMGGIVALAARAAWARLDALAPAHRVTAAVLQALAAFGLVAALAWTVFGMRYTFADLTQNRPFLARGSFLVDRRVETCPPLGQIVAHRQGRNLLLSPVIARAGDRVDIDGTRQLWVNDEALVMERLVTEQGRAALRPATLTVPEGHVVPLGNEALAVPCADMDGLVVYRYSPIRDRGPLEPP